MLDEHESEFLNAIRGGESAQTYAKRSHYSRGWALYMSKRVRRKLGVSTIREALQMTDDTVSRGEFDTLVQLINKLGKSLEDLAERPNDQGQQQVVAQRELDVKDHAKALGLTVEDVEKLKGEKEYGRFKAMQERLDSERAALEEEEEEEPEEEGVGKRILDGLGGIKNVRREQ